MPVTRRAFENPAYRVSTGRALVTALVAVPLATVLVEEVAFRGVLYGLIGRAGGPVAATVITAVLFGLWHLHPKVGLAGTGIVLFTALAGVVFALLRQAGGNLLAPFVAHWAANGLGVLASAYYQRSAR
jgi:membrane protease YdiL (CAAX protease family)